MYQKENEHHLIVKAEFGFYEGFKELGRAMVDKKLLINAEEIFNFTIEEIIQIQSQKSDF